MKEIAFLKQNAEKWKEFETLIKGKGKVNPDVLADLYIHLTDDLSYARTFFPGSKTESYLNSLTATFHQEIYKNKKEDKSRIFRFWKSEFPAMMYLHRMQVLYAFLIFFVSAAIGVLSSVYDDSFLQLILGDAYVKMTMENIEKGEPMAVYKSMNGMDMFMGITLNNIMVAFNAFVLGSLFSIGTGYILFYNGIMLGAFHHFFYAKGLLGVSILSVWMHGTLEITSILIAGGAGIIMGNSILFPGTYSRAQSFMRGAKDGLKIIVGIVPFFIIAGFIEGFLTRLAGDYEGLSIAVISTSFLFLVWYLVIYPRRFKDKEVM